jgi:hypothetical protein
MTTKWLLVPLVAALGSLPVCGDPAYNNNPPPPPSNDTGTYHVTFQAKTVLALNVDGEISALDQTPFDARGSVVDDLHKHVAAAHRDIMKVRFKNDVTFHRPSGELKAEYDAALDFEKAAYADVDARIKEARYANDPQAWDHARRELAGAYRHYAQVVGRAEAIANGYTADDAAPPAPNR